ncbi:MAG: putative transrane outer rane porin signal peptide protein [Polaromonas sp.]|nr:putative transrane outer rane porin signal peptide protein [Polaromonas sp.]
MKFKVNKLAVAAVLCTGASAMAQTSVTLYGIVDVSVRSQTGLTSTYARSPLNTTTVASGVGPTSRWGLRGSEDLGGGLRAFFNVESGINVDTGASANTATFFDRASVIGLAGGWGTVTAGRQNTLVADSVGVVDAIGLRFAGLNPNIQVTSLTGHQLGIEFGTTASTGSSNRVNNSVKYAKPFGPVVARAMYSFGETAGDASRQRSVGLGLDYISSSFSATSAYTTFRDANDRELQAANLGASWLALPALRVMANAGYNRGETSATAVTRNRLLSAGVNYAVTPAVDVLAGYYKVNHSRTAQADDGFNRLLAFAEYKFSRRSRVFLELDKTHWKGNYLGASNKSTSNGVSLGITHTF